MSFAELLVHSTAHAPAADVLDQLSDAEATQRVDGAPHTVAELVAHMTFWQEWFLARSRGESTPIVPHAAGGWPPAPAGAWNSLRERFLAGLQDAVTLGETPGLAERLVSPAIEFPLLAHYTVHDALSHVAVHNAHHLGQVVLLRQLLGKWPPPSGGWTW